METALQIIVGVAVGIAAAAIHLAMAWRGARRLAHSGSQSRQGRWVLVTMPIRVTVAAAMLVLLALWSVAALVAGAAAFAVTERIGLARITRQIEHGGDGSS